MPFLGSKYAKIAIAAPLGELTALPRPLAGLRGPTSKGRGERGGERRGGKERGGKSCAPFVKFLDPPLSKAARIKKRAKQRKGSKNEILQDKSNTTRQNIRHTVDK